MADGPFPAAVAAANLAGEGDQRHEDLGPPPGIDDRRGADALKMQCPFCSSSSSKVLRSYGALRADEVVRRRECTECRRRFPTTEHVDYERLVRELDEAAAAALPERAIGPPRFVDLSLWLIPANWENVERVLHRVWGYARERGYRREEKNALGALQALLTRLRYGA